MVRSKKGKTPEDRLQELFKSPIFRLLQPNLPNLRHKVQLVNADLAEPNCGLAPADQELLVRCAAAADISQQCNPVMQHPAPALTHAQSLFVLPEARSLVHGR